MADCDKVPKSTKYLFVGHEEEDGEVSDSDDEPNENELKQKRDNEFISKWAEKMRQQKEGNDDKYEMDIGSDSEENKIDIKPIAMTITFRDDGFAQKYRGVIESQMVIKFGPDMVDSNNNCIFVFPTKTSNEISHSVTAPLGALSVTFHDENFCTKNHDYMVNLFKEIFGSSKVTSNSWFIEVIQNDLLDFELDTSRYGMDEVLYTKPLSGILDKEPKKAHFSRPQAECFNCGGSHSLNQCKERKNFKIINENREKFRKNKLKTNTRYHAEVEKFSGLLPGRIGSVLRDALGLRSTQLPRYIYHMRKYGYPPGWLEEAKVAHSGVAVYGSQGAVPEEGDEEGEVFEEGEKDRYDIKKIIEFAGFNAAPPPNTEEEHELYDCPPLAAEQDISNMICRLAPNAYKAYKKRRALRLNDGDSDPEHDSNLSSPTETKKSRLINTTTPNKHSSPSTPLASAQPVSMNLGTPILPSASPYAKLPDRDKFGVNISDVINFENLPNSTGTYEKVAGSIQKIRKFSALNSLE